MRPAWSGSRLRRKTHRRGLQAVLQGGRLIAIERQLRIEKRAVRIEPRRPCGHSRQDLYLRLASGMFTVIPFSPATVSRRPSGPARPARGPRGRRDDAHHDGLGLPCEVAQAVREYLVQVHIHVREGFIEAHLQVSIISKVERFRRL